MLRSNLFLPTRKEVSEQAEIPSHILSLRAGLIRQITSGIYDYLPLGTRVINKITKIVKEEMDSIGAQEVILPILQPRSLWEESGRWKEFGKEMIRVKDRKNRDYALGPTHEEVITDLVRREVRSYRDLPLILYQIQPKFRDELRPRSGLLRAREFIMKDAYSFDKDWEGLEENYRKMYDAYHKIFTRCGLKFTVVEADPGLMGGEVSHEFMVPAENGEDIIIICRKCGYAVSREIAPCKEEKPSSEEERPLQEVETPNIRTIEELERFLGVFRINMVKTLILKTEKGPVGVLLRGDHELNITKLKHLLRVTEVEMADASTIEEITGAPVGFSGPVGLTKNLELIADYAVIGMKNFITGANKKDKHLLNVNIGRDFSPSKIGDIRYFTPQDPCPKCGEKIFIRRSIEVGHIFKLGTKYSQSLKACFIDKEGKERPIIMGCYGIGIDRIMVSAIEQHHDKEGIIWPLSIAPFQIIIVPVNLENSLIRETTWKVYEKLLQEGWEVLLDDRKESAGVKFKDADLIGIPFRITIGDTFLREKKIEIRERKTGKILSVESANLSGILKKLIQNQRI